MATTYKTPSRPIGRTNVQKPRTKKVTPRPTPSTSTNNPNQIKTRFGYSNTQNSMNQHSSILKKRSFKKPNVDQQYDENMINYKLPSDLQPLTSRPAYSPIHTPPRLRTLITPPGLEPYRNNYNLRTTQSPLPGIDSWYSPLTGMDTWGLDPTDYRFHTSLMRRYPSPLSRYTFGSSFPKQKKPYIVVPQLSSFVSPPVSSGGANFILPSRRVSPIFIPDSRYTRMRRFESLNLPRIHREPSDYVYIRSNEAFANHYIEDFIGRCIGDEFIPDILLEIIAEIERESKTQVGRPHPNFDRYYTDLQRRKARMEPFDYQEPVPVQSNSRLQYHKLPTDVQARLLADINQELIDFELQNMLTDVSGQALVDNTPRIPIKREVVHRTNTYKSQNPPLQRVDQNQLNAMEKYTQNRLLDTVCLDQLLIKHLKQTGSVVDVDDISRLLDGNILHNLIHQYQTVDEYRSRTLDNYGTKKFHLNSYMNVTMDFLLTELSASLIEDMKDLDEQERKGFPYMF